MKTFRLLMMLAGILLLANVAQPGYGQKDIVVRKPSTTQKSGAATTKKSTTTSKSSGTTAKKGTTKKSSADAAKQQKEEQERAARERQEKAAQEKKAQEDAARERADREAKEQAERERIAREQAAQEEAERQRIANSPILKNLLANMVRVEGGTFMMGATKEQGEDARYDEKPVHQVTLSGYYIGKYEVTQEEWELVMGSNPSYLKGEKHPVEQVSWDDCQQFIAKLNAITGKEFRLPTEAEWEYAARGGNKSKHYRYAGGKKLSEVGWQNHAYGSHNVGQKAPNELGLYDMSGNVWEWCQDWYGEDYYEVSPSHNPQGPSKGSDRVYRGGNWDMGQDHYRVSGRNKSLPSYQYLNIGLRLACSAL